MRKGQRAADTDASHASARCRRRSSHCRTTRTLIGFGPTCVNERFDRRGMWGPGANSTSARLSDPADAGTDSRSDHDGDKEHSALAVSQTSARD